MTSGFQRLISMAAALAPLAFASAGEQPRQGGSTSANSVRDNTPAFADVGAPALISPSPNAGSSVHPQDVSITFTEIAFEFKPHAPSMHAQRAVEVHSGALSAKAAKGTALDADWIRQQFESNGLVGTATSPAIVLSQIQLINQIYAQSGYVNSGLLVGAQAWPENGEALALVLVAGRIVQTQPGASNVGVTWDGGSRKGLSESYIRDRLSEASALPFNAKKLERQFRLLASDLEVKRIDAPLKATGSPGEATFSVDVLPQPQFDAYLAVANSQSPSVGGERASIGGSMRGVIIPGDKVSVEYGVTEGLSDGLIAYRVPISPRWALDFQVQANDANVVDPSLRVLDIQSRARNYDVGVTHTLLERPLEPRDASGGWNAAQKVSLGLWLAHRSSDASLLGMPFSFSPGSVDGHSELTSTRLALNWVKRGSSQVWAASVTTSAGLQGSGSDVAGAPEDHFVSALVQLNHARKLAGGRLELRGRFAGQWANGQLYAAEKFAVGGADTVRGYRENLLLTDSGALASFQLDAPLSFTGRPTGAFDWSAFRVGVFLDSAFVRNEDGAKITPDSITSVGASMSWTPSDAIFAQVSYGEALRDVATTGSHDLQDDGVSFRIVFRPLRMLD